MNFIKMLPWLRTQGPIPKGKEKICRLCHNIIKKGDSYYEWPDLADYGHSKCEYRHEDIIRVQFPERSPWRLENGLYIDDRKYNI